MDVKMKKWRELIAWKFGLDVNYQQSKFTIMSNFFCYKIAINHKNCDKNLICTSFFFKLRSQKNIFKQADVLIFLSNIENSACDKYLVDKWYATRVQNIS